MSWDVWGLLISSAIWAVAGLLSLTVAARERRRGSATWRLPAVFGVVLIAIGVVRLVVAWVGGVA